MELSVDYARKTYVQPGEHVQMLISHSEVCMHMQVAGLVLEVELRDCGPSNNPDKNYHVAQLYRDGKEYSAPIGTGEAGFYNDGDGYYYYPPLAE